MALAQIGLGQAEQHCTLYIGSAVGNPLCSWMPVWKKFLWTKSNGQKLKLNLQEPHRPTTGLKTDGGRTNWLLGLLAHARAKNNPYIMLVCFVTIIHILCYSVTNVPIFLWVCVWHFSLYLVQVVCDNYTNNPFVTPRTVSLNNRTVSTQRKLLIFGQDKIDIRNPDTLEVFDEYYRQI